MGGDARTALGIDIGGTRIRVGVVSADARVLARNESRLPPDGDPEPLREAICEQIADVLHRSEAAPHAAGVALPGVWDPVSTVMRQAVNLPRLEGVDLRDFFTQAVGRRVLLEADANAALWGQCQALTPQPGRLVYLSLGTGVGGGVILDGQILRHTRGGAGHFGFLIADTSPAAPAGRNNVPGCLSALASGPALHLAATGRADPGAIGEEELPETVLAAAARGLAVAIFNLVHLFAPQLVLLGGGVVDNHPRLVEHVRRALAERPSKLTPAGFEVRRAPLTTHEAGVIGVALLALAAESAGRRA
jgi:glucokinase